MPVYAGFPEIRQFNHLQTLGVAQQAKQNRLADMSREYAGAAMGGDENALAKLGGVNPELALNIKQEGRLGKQFTQQEKLQRLDEIASVYNRATTPEQFTQAVKYFQSKGYNLEPQEMDFANRENVVAQAMSLKEQLAQDRHAETLAETKRYHDQIVSRSGGSGGEFGLQPVWGTDANGNPVLYQINKGGGAPQQVQFPEGFTPSPGYSTVDVGTGFAPVNKRTGAVQGEIIPKDVAGEETQKAVGKGVGEARVSLPDVEASADLALKMIGDIRNSPSRALGTGWSSFGNFVPGTPGYDFQQLVDQAAGGAFLQAFQTLKGGGQITEVEGKKATQAIARMQTAQSEEAFLKALDDYEAVIRAGLAKARTKAGAPAADTGGWTTLQNGVRIRQKQ